jgi:hypothetical protein
MPRHKCGVDLERGREQKFDGKYFHESEHQ